MTNCKSCGKKLGLFERILGDTCSLKCDEELKHVDDIVYPTTEYVENEDIVVNTSVDYCKVEYDILFEKTSEVRKANKEKTNGIKTPNENTTIARELAYESDTDDDDLDLTFQIDTLLDIDELESMDIGTNHIQSLENEPANNFSPKSFIGIGDDYNNPYDRGLSGYEDH